jgi:hypothetical protein
MMSSGLQLQKRDAIFLHECVKKAVAVTARSARSNFVLMTVYFYMEAMGECILAKNDLPA